MSSGVQNLLLEVIKWAGLAALFGLFIANLETLKAGLSETIGVDQQSPQTAEGSRPDNARTNGQQRQGNWIERTNRDARAKHLKHAPTGTHSRSSSDERNYAYQPAVSKGPTVSLAADRGGHFYTPVRVNGRTIDVVVDTGATLVAMSYDDARAAGIFVGPNDFKWRSRTANGIAKSARVMIDKIDLGGITVRNVQASVAEPGRLHVTLLGMSFLSKLERFEMSGGKLVLHN